MFLSAREAVQFMANLVHGKDVIPHTEIIRVLTEVGLGDPQLYSRSIGGELAGGLVVAGLSGGEKKRLALACALISRPVFLMLDEITSGLDSENALAVMELVKRVCVDFNVSAVVVIHQPNGYIWEIFDRLILLAHGQCVYSSDINKKDNSGLEIFYETYLGKKMPVSNHEIPLDLLRQLKEPLNLCFGEDAQLVPSMSNDNMPRKQGVPEVYKLGVVFYRNLMNHYIRNPTNLLARTCIYTACALLGGALFWKVGEASDKAGSVVGAFTFTLLNSYLLPFATIASFVHDKKFFLSERALGLYSPWIYCITQLFLEMWVVILAAILQTAIIVPMIGIWNEEMSDWASFFTVFSVIAVSGLAGSSIILFFCILVPSQDLAFILGSGFVTVCLGMSGGFVPFTEIKGFVRWLEWISPCKYSLQGLALAMYKGTDNETFIDMIALNSPNTVSANIGAVGLVYILFALGSVFVLGRTREKR